MMQALRMTVALTFAIAAVGKGLSFAEMTHSSHSRAILGLVLRSTAPLVLIGVVAGIAASAALTRLAASMLAGVSPLDPINLIAVSAILLLTALAAGIAPAWRAAQVSPVVSLRAE